MKKNYGILIASIAFTFLTASIESHAQTKVWSIGPEAGITSSSFGMDAPANDSKVGAVGGLFLTYSILNTFAVTTKFLYYQKGGYFSSSDTKQTVSYFEVPIVGRFFLNKSGNFRPNIFVGPSFAFLTGASQKVGSGESVKYNNYKDIYNGLDVGVTGGIGFNFRILNETYFIIDARYTYGLSDITKANGNVSNNSLGVTAGISFGF